MLLDPIKLCENENQICGGYYGHNLKRSVIKKDKEIEEMRTYCRGQCIKFERDCRMFAVKQKKYKDVTWRINQKKRYVN